MSFDDTRYAVEMRMSNNYTTHPVKYENVTFTPPANAPWVALTILDGSGINASIGTTRRVQRHSGIIQFDIYVPENNGTKTGKDIADEIDGIFNNVQISAGSSGVITTRVPSLATLGVEDGWHHMVLSVAFQRDRIA